MKFLLAICCAIALFAKQGAAQYKFCLFQSNVPVPTDVDLTQDQSVAMRFHVGTDCYAEVYAIDAASLDCWVGGTNPQNARSLFFLRRDVYPNSMNQHNFRFIVSIMRQVQYPFDCHIQGADDDCHAHFQLMCALRNNPSETFSYDANIKFKISEHSRPAPTVTSCKKSSRTRLIVNGAQHDTKGRLEHKARGQSVFSSVCKEGFGTAEAKVACLEMCGDSSYAMEVDGEDFGTETAPIRITQANCKGSEYNFGGCNYQSSISFASCQSGSVGVDCASMNVAVKPILKLGCTPDAFNIKLTTKVEEVKIVKVFIPDTACSWTMNRNFYESDISFQNNQCAATYQVLDDSFKHSQEISVITRLEEEGEVLNTLLKYKISCTRDRLGSANASLIPGTNSDNGMDGNIKLNIELSLYKDMGYQKKVMPGDRLPIDQRLYVQVEAKSTGEVDKAYNLQVYGCNIQDVPHVAGGQPNKFTLIHQSCPRSPNRLNVGIATQAQTYQHRMRFSFLPATFNPNDPNIVLVCNAKLCSRLGDDSQDCKPVTACKPQHNRNTHEDLLSITQEEGVGIWRRKFQNLRDGEWAQFEEAVKSDIEGKSEQLTWVIKNPSELNNEEGIYYPNSDNLPQE